MIKIDFSGLSFQDSDFVNEYYEEGFLQPSDDFIIPFSTVWQGEKYPVQYIYYDTYSFSVKMRDTEYQQFQKIQYASSIIINTGIPKFYKIIDFSSSQYLNEFWNIDIKVRDIVSKKVENIILNSVVDTIEINDEMTSIKRFFDVNLPIIYNTNFENSLIDTFKENVSGYRKVSNFIHLRFFILTEKISDFFEYLSPISLIKSNRIVFRLVKYWDYDIVKEDIGEGLHQIDLKLFTNRYIQS